jgi:hypothetical protein
MVETGCEVPRPVPTLRSQITSQRKAGMTHATGQKILCEKVLEQIFPACRVSSTMEPGGKSTLAHLRRAAQGTPP